MAKRRRQRMRRAYLKRFSLQTVNTGPNKEVMLGYYNRARTIGEKEITNEEADRLLKAENIFFSRQASKLGLTWHSREPVIRNAAAMNKAGQALLQSRYRQHEHKPSEIKLTHKLSLWFTNNMFYFIYNWKGVYQESVIYETRKDAMFAMNNDVIEWIEQPT